MTRNLSLLALCAVLGASGAWAQDLTVAVQKVPDSLDPALENSNVNQRIMWSLFETLIKTDYRNGGAQVPGLAESWEVLDARTIEFKLRDGVTFHNGDTFDAEDVAFTFSPERLNQANDEGRGTVVTKPFLGGIDRVEVIDPLTVRIHMKSDDAIIASRFANYPSQIVSKEAFEAAGSYAEFAKHPIGTGPYMLAEHVLGEKVVIEAFDGFHGDVKAAAETVNFVVTPEISTRIAGLRAGQFDIITEVGPDSIAEIDSASNTSIVGGPVENIRGLIYDSTNAVLADPRIRKAMNMAIDRQMIVDTLYQGRTSVPNGWQMPIFGDMYLADQPQPAYDPDGARALLAEAGYDGAEIVYRSQQEYYTNQGETAQILQAMWAEVGLNVRLDMVETWAQVLEDNEERHIFDGSFTAYYPDPMGQFWRRFGPSGGWAQNGVYEMDADMVALGETLGTSADLEERREVFAEMLGKFSDDPDGAILHVLTQIVGVNERVDFDPMPTLYMDLTTAGLSFKE